MTNPDDKIVEAMSKAYWRAYYDNDGKNFDAMHAALAVARPLIERQARDKALDEAATKCFARMTARQCRNAILDLKATL